MRAIDRDDTSLSMVDWAELAARSAARHDDGLARLPEGADERQRQLTRIGNAAWAAGLSLLMVGRRDEGASWLLRAAERYRESWADAPAASWGRPIASMKARLVAADVEGARADAAWALEAGAEQSDGPIGLYAAALARLVRGEDAHAGRLAASLRGREDFPGSVADAVDALARRDAEAYAAAVRDLLADFETREEFLEDVPAADTVLALQSLAGERGMMVELASPLLPSS
jgi:hypothetical protein